LQKVLGGLLFFDAHCIMSVFVSQFQSSTLGENYNAPCSARLSAIAEHLVRSICTLFLVRV